MTNFEMLMIIVMMFLLVMFSSICVLRFMGV